MFFVASETIPDTYGFELFKEPVHLAYVKFFFLNLI